MYQRTDFKNNLRVISHEMPDRESISVGLFIATGGRYENDQNKGTAHFLEHILFKGSKKYSCSQIKELVEGVGGSLNAFTGEEETCYFAKIPSAHLEQTFSVLSDMVFNPKIAKKDVDKERGVILEEIKMYNDLPQHLVLDYLDQLMWPRHPLGKNLAGTIETVTNISEKDLRGFHSQSYAPRNIVIAATGRLKHKKFVDMARKNFEKLPGGESLRFIPAANSQPKSQVNFFKKDIEQIHLALGMYGLSDHDEDRYTLSLMSIILGGNMSSRLFNQVREKRGLAYSISSYIKSLKDTGQFIVRAGVDLRKIVEAVDVILKELERIKHKIVPADEFKRAKDFYMGQVLLGLEDTMDHMLWIGESILTHNRFKTREEVIGEINKITSRDVQRVAQKILNKKHFNLSLVGPMTPSAEKAINSLLSI